MPILRQARQPPAGPFVDVQDLGQVLDGEQSWDIRHARLLLQAENTHALYALPMPPAREMSGKAGGFPGKQAQFLS